MIFSHGKPLTLKANKNGVIVIRQTPSNASPSVKKRSTPSAETTRGGKHTNPATKNAKTGKESRKVPLEQKQTHLRSSKATTKPEKLSKAKSFHELCDLTPPRSPILPSR